MMSQYIDVFESSLPLSTYRSPVCAAPAADRRDGDYPRMHPAPDASQHDMSAALQVGIQDGGPRPEDVHAGRTVGSSREGTEHVCR